MCPIYEDHRPTHSGGHRVTRPEMIPIPEAEPAAAQKQDLSSGTRRRPSSISFVIALSTILGIVIAAGVILGVVGNAFYVSRDEYTREELKNAAESSSIKATLDRIERSIFRQESAFDKLSDAVQNIKVDMARKKP